MSLTKEFEYDCEIRGPYKAVQVRKSVIIMMMALRFFLKGMFDASQQGQRHMGRH